MTRIQLIVIATTLVAAWSAGATVRQSANQTSSGIPAIANPGVTSAQAPSPTIPGASGTSGGGPVSMAEAVRIAERRTKGRASEVERDRVENIEVYEVKTISKNGPVKAIVEAASGRIERVEESGIWDKIEDLFDDDDSREDAARLSALESAKVTMAKAIEAAQMKAGGEAVEAELRERNGKMLFEVQVLVEGIIHKLTVDHSTGALVTLPLWKKNDADDDEDEDKKN